MKKILFIVLLFLCARLGLAQDLDYEILRTLNKNEMHTWDNGMRNLSVVTNPITVALPVGTLLHGYFTKDKNLIRSGYKSGISICMAMGLSTLLKYTIKRERPFVTYKADIVQRDNPE